MILRMDLGHFFTSNEYFIQALGLIGGVIGVLRMQKKEQKDMMLWHTWLCIPFFFHYMLLGTIVAALQCLVGGVRTFLLAQERFTAYRKPIAAACIATVTLMTAPFWTQDPLGILTLLGLYIGAIGEVQNNVLVYRLCIMSSNVLWLIFSILVGSYGTIFMLTATIASGLFAIYRYHLAPGLKPAPSNAA